jgi:small nuclear ribonucleoprotein (snRNP)-like protein
MGSRKPGLRQQSLKTLLNQELTVYLANGKAVTGILLAFDEKTLQLSGRSVNDPPSYVELQHVTTHHKGRARKKPSDATD